MSSLQGAQTSGPGDHPSHVIQIYPRLKQVTAQCLTLQVTAAQTTAAVIQHAVATLGIDTQRSYSLLELKESDGEETVLEDGEHPVNRYFLWPPETHRWHPKSKGYYFILQPLLQEGEAWLEELVEDYDDLCRLPELSEDALLQTLRKRFYKKKIYTYASSILVAVNPFKFLPCYYNPKYVMMYENQPLGKLSPHIFAVANVAYHAMLNRRLDQCIVISGESGSGKTESSSYLVHCLTALSQKRYASGVVRTLLGAGPVLEAFGNATTAQNNNSSRFGKFVQLNYLESGVIRGAIIEKYLLEKSRLVCRDTSERNYHVFYYLLIGASKEERKEFSLLQPQEYNYLQQEDLSIEGEEKLRHEYKRLHQAMEMVGFLASTKKLIFSILSAILYLGNVTYTVSEEGEVIKVGPDDVLSTLSDLLKVKQELLVNALTQRRAVVSNDTLVLPYMLKEATTARDSMAKSLYSALFDWIVLHINHTLLNRRDMEESVSCLSIGILDIFGFENFQTNSFEQFCINYTNEKLHHYFSQYVFNRQQEEYLSEGISWSTIAYGDNEGVINMFSKKPTGFFHLLDEESNLPQATDGTLLDKLKQHHKDNPLFVGTAVMEPAFVIQHFAGRVKYQIKDFRVKNTDHMRPDVVLLLRGSERAFLRQLVCSSPAALFRWGVLRATIRITAAFRALARRGAQTGRPTRPSGPQDLQMDTHTNRLQMIFSADYHQSSLGQCVFLFYFPCRRNRSGRQKQIIPKKLMDSHSLKHIVALTVNGRTSQLVLHPHQRKKPPSISAQFQASLCNLLDSVGKAEPFFIRCIRSNAEKREMYFDEALVLHQIKYSGMLEMVRIQKAGFGAKYTFEEFVKKFWVLMPKGAAATSEDITKLFQNMGVDQSTYQMGKTKVFLKESQRQRLQETLNKEVMRSVVILQRWFRCCLIRMHFLNKKDAALLIQVYRPREPHSVSGRVASEEHSHCLLLPLYWLTSIPKDLSATESIFLSATSEFRVIIKCMYKHDPHFNIIHILKRKDYLIVPFFSDVIPLLLGMVSQDLCPVNNPDVYPFSLKMENPLDHMFSTYQVNIMQSCDLCGSYIWGMEKAYMCSACKLICHKKCLAKIITDCLTRCARKDSSTSGSLHFGVDVSVLSSPAQPVPQVLEMLLVYVEMNGLDTEGIYRKSGSACRARELHQILETNPETASLENYPIHTITGLVKRWLRELPEPLMTFNLYNDFLHAAELPEKSERIRAIYQKVDELPESNYSTLERLIFHLVKVAKEEVHNRMTASSLAIVFAPCIMRSPDADDPFLGMKDVNKTTQCVEVLIMEQFRRYTEKMQNIKELEYAETLAIHQLQLKSSEYICVCVCVCACVCGASREDLACTLPDLEQETSDDNLDNQWSVSSDSLGSDRLGSLDSEGQ
uniref:Myosin IXb n=1 Tax=Gadus morhua TaxID=8049 RepID=A0A8C5BWW2_GADMO